MRDYTPQEVRAWAKAQGFEVGDRGRLPELLEARYVAAGAPEMARVAPVPGPRPPKAHSGAQGVAGTVAHLPTEKRRMLGENDYDPRAFLFDADSKTVCVKRWGFKSVRENWTIEQIETLSGEPDLIPTMAGLPERFADEYLT